MLELPAEALRRYESAMDELQAAADTALRIRLDAIQARLPKRKVEFVDAMGQAFVTIDDAIASHVWPERVPIMQEILQLESDAAKFSDDYRICFNSILKGPGE